MFQSIRIATLGGIVLSIALIFPATVAAAKTTNEWTPVHYELYNECGNGGLGETIIADGQFHAITTWTVDQAGGFRGKALVVAAGIEGYGEITGTKYQVVIVLPTVFAISANGGVVMTQSALTKLVSQGNETDSTFWSHFVFVMTPSGIVPVDMYLERITCG